MSAQNPSEGNDPVTSTDMAPTDGVAAMVEICRADALDCERGAAALLPDGTQIGVFVLDDGTVHAVQQHDPYSGTNILSRGLVGTHLLPGSEGGPERIVPTLASPMYKQVWNLADGTVIDSGGKGDHPLAVFDAEIRDGVIRVATSPREPGQEQR